MELGLKEILEAVNNLGAKIDSRPKTQLPPTRSEELNELFSALCKTQSEMKVAGLNSENPFFKSNYADLTEIVRVSRPVLTRHGLSVLQQVTQNEEGGNVLVTILAHNSGQWISSMMKITPTKPDIQAFASYMSYLKRYSYAALIGVVTGDEDDDGERAIAERVPYSKPNGNHTNSSEAVTKEQLDMLNYELRETPELAEEVMKKLQIQTLAEMPKIKFQASITRIRDLKQYPPYKQAEK